MKKLFFLLFLSAISLNLCSSEKRDSLDSLEDGTRTLCNSRRASHQSEMDIFEPRDRDDIVSEIMVSPSSPSCRPMMVSFSSSYSPDADVDNYAHEQAARFCRRVDKPQMGTFFNVAQDFYKRNNMHPTHPAQMTRARRITEPVDGLDLSSSPRSRDEEEDNTSLLTLMIEQLAHQHELEKQRLQLEKEKADGAHAEWVAERKTQQEQWVAERKSSNRRFQAAQKQVFKTNVLWGVATVSSLFVGAGSWIWG